MVCLFESQAESFITILIGCRIGQVRVIFSLHGDDAIRLFGDAANAIPKHLAYIEWFRLTHKAPRPYHKLYRVKRRIQNGDRLASIVPVSNIRRSVHLFPVFGPIVPAEWTSDNVLEKCDTFYINCFSDRYAYHTIL